MGPRSRERGNGETAAWVGCSCCPQCLHLRVGVTIFVTNCVTRNFIRNANILDHRILNHLGARLSLKGGGLHQVVSYCHWLDPSTFAEYLNEIFPWLAVTIKDDVNGWNVLEQQLQES